MDAVAYSLASKQAQRIEKFIENPDSTSGIVTVPKVIGAGENITIPAGRVAVLPNVQVDGTLNIEGEVFIPSGATFSKVVETEGNQTIDGIKTFVKSPIVPTPAENTQVANKEYVDLKVALTAFTGANQSLSENGYQKLPGGLIIQWGVTLNALSPNTGVTVNFPISFPNLNFIGLATLNGRESVGLSSALYDKVSNSQCFISSDGDSSSTGPARKIFWIAIGY